MQVSKTHISKIHVFMMHVSMMYVFIISKIFHPWPWYILYVFMMHIYASCTYMHYAHDACLTNACMHDAGLRDACFNVCMMYGYIMHAHMTFDPWPWCILYVFMMHIDALCTITCPLWGWMMYVWCMNIWCRCIYDAGLFRYGWTGAAHTAPQPCQPDRLGTLDFLLD